MIARRSGKSNGTIELITAFILNVVIARAKLGPIGWTIVALGIVRKVHFSNPRSELLLLLLLLLVTVVVLSRIKNHDKTVASKARRGTRHWTIVDFGCRPEPAITTTTRSFH